MSSRLCCASNFAKSTSFSPYTSAESKWLHPSASDRFKTCSVKRRKKSRNIEIPWELHLLLLECRKMR
jgi:hypothetical protein